MDLISALILGLVEGLTEFLPVSSTAHLVLTSSLLGLEQSAFVKTFEIAIQSGAILAVVLLFWKRFLDLEVLKRLAAAFVPTAIIGLALHKTLKESLLGNLPLTLSMLALGGVILIVFEKWREGRDAGVHLDEAGLSEDAKLDSLSYKTAMLVGVAQSVAIIPGVSRSAATIIGGMLLGMSRKAIVEFSFLLAVPTILSATVLDLAKSSGTFSSGDVIPLGIGFLASFATALVSIRFFLKYISKHSFTVFGVYRIILVAVFILLVM